MARREEKDQEWRQARPATASEGADRRAAAIQHNPPRWMAMESVSSVRRTEICTFCALQGTGCTDRARGGTAGTLGRGCTESIATLRCSKVAGYHVASMVVPQLVSSDTELHQLSRPPMQTPMQERLPLISDNLEDKRAVLRTFAPRDLHRPPRPSIAWKCSRWAWSRPPTTARHP